MNDNHTFSLFYPLNNGSAGEFLTSSSNILTIASAHILLPQLKALHYIIDKEKACYLLPFLKYQTAAPMTTAIIPPTPASIATPGTLVGSAASASSTYGRSLVFLLNIKVAYGCLRCRVGILVWYSLSLLPCFLKTAVLPSLFFLCGFFALGCRLHLVRKQQ